jgi:molybdate transport system permease protein
MGGTGALAWEPILLSIRVALWAVVLDLPLALAAGWIIARGRAPITRLLDMAAHLPLVVPPVVTGYLLLLAFGPRGPIGAPLADWFGITLAFHWSGAVLAAMVMAFPLIVRPIRLSFESVDRGLESAARTMGASRVMAFLTVSLPLAAPGVLAGALLGFARALGEFGATITFVSNIEGATETLPMAVYTALQVPGAEATALTLSVLAIIIACIALMGSELLAARVRGRVLQGEGAAHD